MASRPAATRVILGEAGIEHVGGQLFLNLHIMNVGEAPLDKLHVTAMTLGKASRASPPGFPIVIDLIGASATAHLTARFSSASLEVGEKYLFTLGGTYALDGRTYGLSLNRYIRLPPASAPALPTLHARVASAQRGGHWNYTVFNDEAPASGRAIATLSLSIAAPVAVTGIPPGWAVETDGRSFVLWYAADDAPPYPHQVAPGAALGGFQLASTRSLSEATPAALSSWQHGGDEAGPVLSDYVLTPYRFADRP
ncbi:hypothetical protein HF313_11530 [Massilia atriviolacea]|uniref:Uncharacterized protein n=1 Tax=Massilia atriviolacea TaxID=2495579 RepID=A0A430HIM8_9BURK|nr:hypothetical protein [Massilia atriviolacea]RSZ57368.1 hypothetical protein EJB06_19655 [Massilia atriviolacea]